MHLAFIDQLWNTQLLRNISWTLVHAVWQGMAAGLLAAALLAFTRRRPAALRYRLLLGTLLLFMAGVVLTFLLQTPASAPLPDPETAMPASAAPAFFTINRPGGTIAYITAFFDTNAQAIVLCWLLLGALRLMHLLLGFRQLARLRRRQVAPAGIFWDERLRQLAAAVSVQRPVRLLQSALVQAPVVISYFKPVILVPLGLLTVLPQDEVEAILLHELAHIRRKDFLVNFLQHIVETLFFFHPVVLWISARIREEREHCCDDAALDRISGKTTLVRAMIACRELGSAPGSYALAFGTQRQLLHRARRIINKTPRPFHAVEKIIVGLCAPLGLLLVLFLLPAFRPVSASVSTVAGRQDTLPPVKNKTMDIHDETTGTVENIDGVPHEHYTFRRQGVVYEVEAVKEKIVLLKIDGRIIDEEHRAAELPAVNQLIAEYRQLTEQPLVPLVTLAKEPQPSAARSERPQPANLKGLSGLNGSTTDLQTEQPVQERPHHTTYFGKGYKIVTEDGAIREVDYKGKRLTGAELARRQPEIDAIFKKNRP